MQSRLWQIRDTNTRMKRKSSESEEKQAKCECSYVISFGFTDKYISARLTGIYIIRLSFRQRFKGCRQVNACKCWHRVSLHRHLLLCLLKYLPVINPLQKVWTEQIEEFSSIPSDKKSSQLQWKLMEMLSPSDLVIQQAQEHLDRHNFPKEHTHKDTHTHTHTDYVRL